MRKNTTAAITTPKGFLFSAVEAAIRKPGRKDLALIYSQKEAVMSGTFTTNKVKAAPVRLDKRRIRSGRGQAIVVNSGNANACTGRQGMCDALEMTALVEKGLCLKRGAAYACSTGVIGTPMPMDRIREKIPGLIAGLGRGSIHDAASAIMTTDTFPKAASRTIRIGNRTGVIAGICKGAGMICPHMATMLCFVMTDLAVSKAALDRALKESVESSFNKITIDGDMSTNDTVLIMANGVAENEPIRDDSRGFKVFASALKEITSDLSRLIVRDGEGATKLVEVEVRNARDKKDAEKASFAIAKSLLVKTAIYGNDANWGRIMAALGYSGIALREEKTDIFFGNVRVVKDGVSAGKDREAAEVLKGKELKIAVDLRMGNASSRILTCDLTEEYVRTNAEYRT